MGRPAQPPKAYVFIWAPAFLVLGYLIMIFALVFARDGVGAEFTGPLLCGEQPMRKDGICHIMTLRGSQASSGSYTYEELLARRQFSVRETPWTRGVLAGTVGTVLIIVAAGRRLVVHKRSTRRAVRTSLLLTAIGPMLVASGLVGLIERQYEREFRERSMFLTFPGSDLPGNALVMAAVTLVAAAVTLVVIRACYRNDPDFVHVYPPRVGSRPARGGPAAAAVADPPDPAPPDPAPPDPAPDPDEGAARHQASVDPQASALTEHPASQSARLPLKHHPPAARPSSWYTPPVTPPAPTLPRPVSEPPRSYSLSEKRIGWLRSGQLMIAIVATVWLGVISQWHWGYVLFALVGTGGIGFLGVNQKSVSPGAEVGYQLLALVAGLGAVLGTGWIGVSSGWHAGIVAMCWFGITVAVALSGNVIEEQGTDEPDRADHRIRLPLAATVPVLLATLGVCTTVLVGGASGWRWLVVLVVWAAVVTMGIGYVGASLPLIQRKAGGWLAGHLRRAGALPIGALLAGAAGSYWIGELTDWRIVVQLLLWGSLAVSVIGPEALLARRSQPPARAE